MPRGRYCAWILFGSLLLTVVYGLNDCLPSREVYVNLNLGPPEDVPLNFTSGISWQLYDIRSYTADLVNQIGSYRHAGAISVVER